jgi:hypothetical protein
LTSIDWPALTLTTPVRPHGTFSFSSVWPGRYSLVASIEDPAAVRSSEAEMGSRVVDLSAGASARVGIVTSPPGVLAGTVRFEGAPALTAAERAAVWVAAIPVDVPLGLPVNSQRSPVEGDGRFRLQGVHGRRVIRVEGLPAGWILSSVSQGGGDDPDAVIDVTNGRTLSDVGVLVARSAGALTGTVVDDTGAFLAGGAVLAFAADPTRWTYPSRFVRSAAVQPNGTFRVTGVPPGDYLVAHVATLKNGWDAPDSLHPLRDGATAVTVAPGRETPLAMKVSK